MNRPIVRVAADESLRALELLREALETESFAVEIVNSAPESASQNLGAGLQTTHPRTALVLQTSGSTGRPKKVELSAEALRASAAASAERIGSGQWLLTLPINYIAGAQVLIRSIWADTQPIVLTGGVTPKSLAEATSRMDSENRFLSLIPTQLRRISQYLEQPSELVTTLREYRAILVGGQLPDSELIHRLKQSGVPIVTSYGLTETSGGCVYDGVPLEGTSVRLDSDGTIEISSVQLAEGIGPWFRTADLGEISDGKLRVLGRRDRVINSGGIKLALELVEEKTLEIPGVEDCCAVALDDADWGQRVGLLVAGSPQNPPAEWLRDQFGVAAVPARLIVGAVIPRLDSGKPDYESARALLLG
ncbi:MAG: hypothetical protein RL198_900 [Actinomycetota bacterium]